MINFCVKKLFSKDKKNKEKLSKIYLFETPRYIIKII